MLLQKEKAQNGGDLFRQHEDENKVNIMIRRNEKMTEIGKKKIKNKTMEMTTLDKYLTAYFVSKLE